MYALPALLPKQMRPFGSSFLLDTMPPTNIPLTELRTLSDVAAFLEISREQLAFLIRARPVGRRYSRFTIPKRRGGERTILAPKEDLKFVQRQLAGRLAE
ncbi:MAG TPA: hypothetical protein VFE24_16100, partial [Pirellulales bacterium]|nr:hypothetical protein [Pirellulales bacterium]